MPNPQSIRSRNALQLCHGSIDAMRMPMPNIDVSETLSSFRPAPACAHMSHRAPRGDESMRSVAARSIHTTEPAGTRRHAIRVDTAYRNSWIASPVHMQTREQ
ncbi:MULTISPECIES: hypothetical protein [Burkholderia]|uniref:Uncharacterized protein n=1 Tax=Burkholderia mayonis TaxID=1385591 RepID=A0A1B4FL17_9BURK|nr:MULTISPECIES: hypothetical protein [Burkholderia]AOJ04365.1 hypothetical protein WS70_21195 [Burkholderia mayonis]KVE43954.1 hypothetical protein WS69_22065 [Burkholderia sp. BDU5]